MGQPDKALPVLASELHEGPQWARLHAAIVLDEGLADFDIAIPRFRAARHHTKSHQAPLLRQGNRPAHGLNKCLDLLDDVICR